LAAARICAFVAELLTVGSQPPSETHNAIAASNDFRLALVVKAV
jgi:hypothetical protein